MMRATKVNFQFLNTRVKPT
uniref:Uncharacterized protein n=1 Tax=Arundo donax TaxID=35708 RepID=A0A0A8YB39_ARUDO